MVLGQAGVLRLCVQKVGRWALSSAASKDPIRNAGAEFAPLAARQRSRRQRKTRFLKEEGCAGSFGGCSLCPMLSSFAYSAFDPALPSACLQRRAPAGQSRRRLDHRLKVARRYGLSVHEVAPSHRPPGDGLPPEIAPFQGSCRKGADERLCPCHPHLPYPSGIAPGMKDRVEWTKQGAPQEGACSARIVRAKVPTRMATQDAGGGVASHFSHATNGWSRARKEFLD